MTPVRTSSGESTGGSAFELKGHRFVRHLAQGGTSAVYLMENEKTGNPIVVKVLRDVPDVSEGESTFQRFLQEYELVSTIRHPNVVTIHDLGVADRCSDRL